MLEYGEISGHLISFVWDTHLRVTRGVAVRVRPLPLACHAHGRIVFDTKPQAVWCVEHWAHAGLGIKPYIVMICMLSLIITHIYQ